VTNVGFGGAPWGGAPWGGSGSPVIGVPLGLLAAVATVENVVRLEFTQPPFFSGLLEADDASNPTHYAIAPVAGTVGLDGTPAQPVSVIAVQIGEDPASLDLFLDRPMTAAPALYSVTVTGLTDAATRTPMSPNPTSQQFLGLLRAIAPPAVDTAAPSRDIANPQTASALSDPLPVTTNPLLLGTYVVDDTGDYALDEGLVSLKKRIYRRLITIVGGFAHLPNYGVGIPGHVKRLGSPALRAKLARDAEDQIRLEPEVATVSVKAVTDPAAPGLVVFVVRVKTRTGQAMKPFAVPFSVS